VGAAVLAVGHAPGTATELKVDPQRVAPPVAHRILAPSALTAPHRSSTPGDQVTFEAVLTDPTGQPLGGRSVAFESGLFSGSGTTDEQGKATWRYRVPVTLKADTTYPFTASYPGDGEHGAAKASQGLWIVKGATRVVISNLPWVADADKKPWVGVGAVTVLVTSELDGHVIPNAPVDVRTNGGPPVAASGPQGQTVVVYGGGPWTLDCQSHATDSYLAAHATRTIHR